MAVAVPYDWLRHVPHSFVEKEELPIFGYSPPFPWDQLTAIFGKIFRLENVQFSSVPWQMRSEDELYAGLGSQPLPLVIEFSPLEGELYFLMAQTDVERLMKLFLSGSEDSAVLIDPDYRQGFYQFVALEFFNVFTKLEYAKGVLPHLLNQNALPTSASLCQDITLHVNNSTFMGRLVVSDQLRKSWKERHSERSLTVSMPKAMSSKIQVVVHFEAGRVSLTQAEWQEIALGDCVLLDQCSLERDGDKGRVILTLNNKPLYRAKVKDGTIKILESPLFHEIDTPITPKMQQEAQVPDTFDEEFTDFDEDFSEIENTTLSDAVEEEASPKEESSRTKQEAAVSSKKAPEAQTTVDGVSVAQTSPRSLEDIPLTVVIEIGRMQISVQKLLELEPGNLLELDIHPENGVDLVVNGNVIGKGELLKVGDSLGVRLLDKA